MSHVGSKKISMSRITILKPIYHWKLSSRWLTSVNGMDTKNMKSTWQCQPLALGTQCHLYSTCLRWGLALEVTQILAFLNTNMFVSPTRLGSKPTPVPKASVFAPQWNIGLMIIMGIKPLPSKSNMYSGSGWKISYAEPLYPIKTKEIKCRL